MEIKSNREVLHQLGREVRGRRLRRNVTQSELAGRAQVAEGTVRRLENGQGSSVMNFLRITSVLGCRPSVKELLGREEIQSLEDMKPVVRERARSARRG